MKPLDSMTSDNLGALFALFGHVADAPTPNKMRIRENHYIVCENGRVVDVFPELPERYLQIPVVRYDDCLILPGMIDLHIHAPQYAFRGIGMDEELILWLEHRAFPEEAKYSDVEYAKRAYSFFASEMKTSATTRAAIFATHHREATECLMDCMEETGLVTYIGKVNMDREAAVNHRESGPDESKTETLAWLHDIEGKYQRTMPILTPRFIPSCSNQLLEALCDIRRDFNLPVQSHLSENVSEIEWVKALCPDSDFYGDAYDCYELFGEHDGIGGKTIMAHCVWSCDAEVKRISQNGVFVAHCPGSNMNIGSGIAPIRRYLDAGIRIGLGTDVAAGQSTSVFRAITDAIAVSKLYWRLIDTTKKPLLFSEAFYLATRGGGAFFGNVGAFVPGFAMDAIVLDDSALLHPQPLSVQERVERAIYLRLDGSGICGKYVDGKSCL